MGERLKSTAEMLWQDDKVLGRVLWIGLKRAIKERPYSGGIVSKEVEFDTPMATQPLDYAVEPELPQAA